MSRTKSWSILFVAAAAFLGAFLVRDTGDRSPVERTRTPVALRTADPARSEDAARELEEEASRPGPSAPGRAASEAARPAEEKDPEDAEEGEVDEAALVRLYGETPLTTDHPQVKSAIEIQERNTDWLMAHPAVVGTGVGLNGKGEVALLVLTRVDAPELPKVVEGLPVVVEKTGEIHARNRQDATVRTHTGGIGGTAEYARPVPIGVSSGHFNITAGTIGCRVKNAAGDVFALSNNHVYANENLGAIGDNCLQPGPFDGGVNPDDAIGTLHDFQPILFDGSNNTIDAAIAVSSTSSLGNATPSGVGYGIPKSATQSASFSLKVKKVGRTTGSTSSRVTGLNVTVNVGYDSGVARFVGQIYISSRTFSAGGDSGSLIVVNGGKNDRRPVGLLFAGSANSTIANPIGPVLSRFGVTVDGN